MFSIDVCFQGYFIYWVGSLFVLIIEILYAIKIHLKMIIYIV